jgi:hypothetical protein
MKATPLLLSLIAIAFPAWGQAFKCRMPDGSTQISSEPCAGGARTLREVDEEVIPDSVREQAERNAARQRREADKMEAERKADAADERREAEAARKAAGLPAPAAIQNCLNTVGRMNIDASRRAELEAGCQLTGQVQPIYNETYQPPIYYGSGYYLPYPNRPYPPRPYPPQVEHPIAPLPASRPTKPVDLYKVPSPPARGGR